MIQRGEVYRRFPVKPALRAIVFTAVAALTWLPFSFAIAQEPHLVIDTVCGETGADRPAVIRGVRDGCLFGFAVHVSGAGDFVAEELSITWDGSLASMYRSLTGPDVPSETLAFNGFTTFRLLQRDNILSASGNRLTRITGDDTDGRWSATYVKSSGDAVISGGGLLGFAAFKTKTGFERSEALTLTVSATLIDAEGRRIECPPVAATVIPWRPPAEITAPREHERLTSGALYTIRWKNAGSNHLRFEFSSDNGGHWRAVSDVIDASAGLYAWTVPSVESSQCRLRFLDVSLGGYADTLGVAVAITRSPSVTLRAKAANSGTIPVEYSIIEPSGRPVSLLVDYSRDYGATWKPATLDRSAVSLDNRRYSGMFYWLARHDLDSFTGSVLLRSQALLAGNGSTDTITVAVDFNTRPSVVLDGLPSKLSGNVALHCTASDTENDSVAVALYYTVDGESVWKPATVAGMSANGSQFSFTWLSQSDIPDRVTDNVRLGIEARDDFGGSRKEYGPFSLDNRVGTLNGLLDTSGSYGLPVLAFHSVQYNTIDNTYLSVTPDMFVRLVRELKSAGYSFVSTADYLDHIEYGSQISERSVLLSFDDGYRTMYDVLMPLLEKEDIRASFNIIVARIGSENFLTRSNIEEMYATNRADFQSHSFNLHGTRNNEPLIYKFFFESDIRYANRIISDISGSADYLGQITGERAISFTVPFGIGDEDIETFSQKAGVRAVFYIGNDAVNSYGDNPYHLDRISITRANIKITGKLLSLSGFPKKASIAEKSTVTNSPHIVLAAKIPGGVLASSPALGPGNALYIGGRDGTLFALDKRNGSIVWRYKTGGIITSTPAVGEDGVVYVGSYDYSLYALSPGGGLLWKYNVWAPCYASPAIQSDGCITVGSTDGGIVTVDPSGRQVWNYRTGDAVFSSPAVNAGGTIYTGTWNNFLLSLASDGSYRWTFRTGGGVESSPALGPNGEVYFGCMDGFLYAVESNGSLIWKYRLGEWVDSSPAVAEDGTIYIGGRYGCLYAISGEGALKWRFETGGRIETTPAIGIDGTLYFGSWDGRFYAVGADGVEKWRFQTGGGIDSSPVVDDNGIVYFASTDGYVYGIDTGTNVGLAGSWPAFGGNAQRTGTNRALASAGKAADAAADCPVAFGIGNPSPNPFNPRTIIRYSIPRQSRAVLTAYTVNGQKAAVLADFVAPAGNHTVSWDASGLPSGVYIIRLDACGRSAVTKALLLK